jgi:hypothetical protein
MRRRGWTAKSSHQRTRDGGEFIGLQRGPNRAIWPLDRRICFYIAYMLFIVFNLARDAKAGKFGTFVLFLVLGFGMLGFVAKQVIKWFLGLD